MTSFRRRFLLQVFELFDLFVLAFSLCLAVLGGQANARLSMLLTLRIQVHTILVVMGLLYGWHLFFMRVGLYESRRLASPADELKDLLKALAYATLLLVAAGVLFRLPAVTPLLCVRFLSISVPTLIASRLALRWWLKHVRIRGRNLRHLLIAGTNSRAQEFARTIDGRPELGYRLLGFVDDEWFGPPLDHGDPGIVTNLEEFRFYLRNHIVDEVVLALPIKSFYSRTDKLITLCREQGILVRVLSDFFESSSSLTRVDQFESSAIVTFYHSPIGGMSLVAKRMLDIASSLALLLLLSPILLLVALLVRLDSLGPAFFVQERVGLNKHRFRMFKFRTMVADAEQLQARLESQNEVSGPAFKIKQDPRITRLGKFLRKASIDELPQLINVLKGDMSLVGPRPLPVRDYEGFDKDWQRRRFSVRPGITCLWQVSGRSGIAFEEWMDLDMKYIDQWSLWLDMKILAKTIPAVMRGSGAA
jgi:exopolysaccharide biosynthesis polyprenyl glycosylphosphotransferase